MRKYLYLLFPSRIPQWIAKKIYFCFFGQSPILCKSAQALRFIQFDAKLLLSLRANSIPLVLWFNWNQLDTRCEDKQRCCCFRPFLFFSISQSCLKSSIEIEVKRNLPKMTNLIRRISLEWCAWSETFILLLLLLCEFLWRLQNWVVKLTLLLLLLLLSAFL